MAEILHSGSERAQAFNTLLSILLTGKAERETVEQYQQLLDSSLPVDLVRTVDSAVAAGISFETLKPAVSKLINLMYNSLVRHRYQATADAFFLQGLCRENLGLKKRLDQGKKLALAMNSDTPAESDPESVTSFVAELLTVESHFRKKENILFPWFEAKYPEYKCVRLMWEIHDDIRQGLKELSSICGRAKEAGAPPQSDKKWLSDFNTCLGTLYFNLNTNIFREECALYPVLAPLISSEQDKLLFEEADQLGWCFMAAGEQAEQRALCKQAKTLIRLDQGDLDGNENRGASGFVGRTGSLPPAILTALFSTIHLDMTWVDADDRVRWFSDSPKRIFPRSPAIIGRDVRNCHPGSSVDRVIAILNSFKSGKKSHEEFWLSIGDRFIHIEYFALRSADGCYLGTLEASEDLTHKRGLQGEKRLAEDS